MACVELFSVSRQALTASLGHLERGHELIPVHSKLNLVRFHLCGDESASSGKHDRESKWCHTDLPQSAIIIDKPDEPTQPLFPRGQLVC